MDATCNEQVSCPATRNTSTYYSNFEVPYRIRYLLSIPAYDKSPIRETFHLCTEKLFKKIVYQLDNKMEERKRGYAESCATWKFLNIVRQLRWDYYRKRVYVEGVESYSGIRVTWKMKSWRWRWVYRRVI